MSLNTNDLAWMRAHVVDQLPDTCVIHMVTRVSDGAGGWSETLSPAGTVNCLVSEVRTSDMTQLRAERPALKIAYRISLPHDAPLAQDSIITFAGTDYQVLYVAKDDSWRIATHGIIGKVE